MSVRPSRARIALVAPIDDATTALSGYLSDAGFEVHEQWKAAAPRTFDAVILIDARGDSREALHTEVRSWIESTKSRAIVVVTPKPIMLADLVSTYGPRLCVLPAPAFGWELVDRIRAAASRSAR